MGNDRLFGPATLKQFFGDLGCILEGMRAYKRTLEQYYVRPGPLCGTFKGYKLVYKPKMCIKTTEFQKMSKLRIFFCILAW